MNETTNCTVDLSKLTPGTLAILSLVNSGVELVEAVRQVSGPAAAERMVEKAYRDLQFQRQADADDKYCFENQ